MRQRRRRRREAGSWIIFRMQRWRVLDGRSPIYFLKGSPNPWSKVAYCTKKIEVVRRFSILWVTMTLSLGWNRNVNNWREDSGRKTAHGFWTFAATLPRLPLTQPQLKTLKSLVIPPRSMPAEVFVVTSPIAVIDVGLVKLAKNTGTINWLSPFCSDYGRKDSFPLSYWNLSPIPTGM